MKDVGLDSVLEIIFIPKSRSSEKTAKKVEKDI